MSSSACASSPTGAHYWVLDTSPDEMGVCIHCKESRPHRIVSSSSTKPASVIVPRTKEPTKLLSQMHVGERKTIPHQEMMCNERSSHGRQCSLLAAITRLEKSGRRFIVHLHEDYVIDVERRA